MSRCLNILLVLALLAPIGTTFTGAARGETVVEARQRLMVSIVRATKVPRAMVAGEAPFDEAAVKAAVKQVLEATAVMPRLFPDGSLDATSTALPAIFENRADFEIRLLELEKAAVALAFAAKQGPEDFKFAFSEYEASCDSCHAKYRKPE